MKALECNRTVYQIKMAAAVLTIIAAWCGPLALFAYVLG